VTDDRRPTDHEHPTDDRPIVRFESRLPRGDRSPLVPIAALGLLVAVALVTARAAAPGLADASSGASGGAVAAEAGSLPSQSQPRSAADEAVATICYEPLSWRTATIETWRDRTVRVWRAIDPVAASGPLDPAIPIVPAVGSRVAAIGFCAPIAGPDRPADTTTIEAWRRTQDGDGGGGASGAVPVDLRRLVPAGSSSPLGGLFGPPVTGTGASGGWPAGVVVFRFGQPDRSPDPGAVWFGVEVIDMAAIGNEPAPSATPRP
jgi:hypothetical protein